MLTLDRAKGAAIIAIAAVVAEHKIFQCPKPQAIHVLQREVVGKGLVQRSAINQDNTVAQFNGLAWQADNPFNQHFIHTGQIDHHNIVARWRVELIAELVNDQPLIGRQIWLHALAKNDRCLGQKEMNNQGEAKRGHNDLDRFTQPGWPTAAAACRHGPAGRLLRVWD